MTLKVLPGPGWAVLGKDVKLPRPEHGVKVLPGPGWAVLGKDVKNCPVLSTTLKMTRKVLGTTWPFRW